MSHTCASVLLHLIFSTHERRPLIKPDFRDDLFAYLGGSRSAAIIGLSARGVYEGDTTRVVSSDDSRLSVAPGRG